MPPVPSPKARVRPLLCLCLALLVGCSGIAVRKAAKAPDLHDASQAAALSKCIAAAQRVGRLDPRQELRLPAGDGGAFTLSVVHAGFPWKDEEFGPLLPCDDYEVEGLQNQHHAYGLGVPLIAVRAADA